MNRNGSPSTWTNHGTVWSLSKKKEEEAPAHLVRYTVPCTVHYIYTHADFIGVCECVCVCESSHSQCACAIPGFSHAIIYPIHGTIIPQTHTGWRACIFNPGKGIKVKLSRFECQWFSNNLCNGNCNYVILMQDLPSNFRIFNRLSCLEHWSIHTIWNFSTKWWKCRKKSPVRQIAACEKDSPANG